MKVAKDCIVNPAEVAAVVFATKESAEAAIQITIIVLHSGHKLKIAQDEILMSQADIEKTLAPFWYPVVQQVSM